MRCGELYNDHNSLQLLKLLTSLDFVVNRFFMRLFKTTDMQVVEVCREQFDLELPSMQIDRQRSNFVSSVVTTDSVTFFPCVMRC